MERLRLARLRQTVHAVQQLSLRVQLPIMHHSRRNVRQLQQQRVQHTRVIVATRAVLRLARRGRLQRALLDARHVLRALNPVDLRVDHLPRVVLRGLCDSMTTARTFTNTSGMGFASKPTMMV